MAYPEFRKSRDFIPNPITELDDYILIHCVNGKSIKIDKEDYWKIAQFYGWHASEKVKGSNKFYATAFDRINRRKKHKKISLHRSLFKIADNSQCIDHINGDPLDNRRLNLRACSYKENQRNKKPMGKSSRFKGVHFDKSRNKWKTEIKIDERRIHLGRFHLEKDAAEAYKQAALKYFGEFAYRDSYGG